MSKRNKLELERIPLPFSALLHPLSQLRFYFSHQWISGQNKNVVKYILKISLITSKINSSLVHNLPVS